MENGLLIIKIWGAKGSTRQKAEDALSWKWVQFPCTPSIFPKGALHG